MQRERLLRGRESRDFSQVDPGSILALLFVENLVSCLTSMSLDFFICKMGEIGPISIDCGRIKEELPGTQ